MNKPTVAKLAEIIEKRYPKSLAVEWDRVGLETNNQELEVERVLLTIDVTPEVIAEAIEKSINLIVSHHPLILDPEEISDIQEKRISMKKELENKNVALYVAHTNADIAQGGVNDSLAKILGLKNIKVFGIENMGRIGDLSSQISLGEFIKQIKSKLPEVSNSIQVSGNLENRIFKVAVCGGSGASLLPEIRQTEADVFVTADLKHHVVSDHQIMHGPALISVSHWASEWVWLPELKNQLEADFASEDLSVQIFVSNVITDPWSFSLGSEK
ncbi:MAG: hypothetical protein RIS18_944 [Actinomycetota bacterium]